MPTADYTIEDGINRPVALALDGAGNLYVASVATVGNGFISVYAPKSKKPVRKVTGNRFGTARALAFGSQ